jgi:hypothetical protein
MQYVCSAYGIRTRIYKIESLVYYSNYTKAPFKKIRMVFVRPLLVGSTRLSIWRFHFSYFSGTGRYRTDIYGFSDQRMKPPLLLPLVLGFYFNSEPS